MKFNEKCVNIVKKYEGFESKPYLCPAKIPTIGYGATFYPNGKKVTLQDIPINESYAAEILNQMLNDFADKVKKLISKELNDNQFGALVSFAYNVGIGNLQSSTLLKKININPKDLSIKEEFLKWNKAAGKVLSGLSKRREEESNLYFM